MNIMSNYFWEKCKNFQANQFTEKLSRRYVAFKSESRSEKSESLIQTSFHPGTRVYIAPRTINTLYPCSGLREYLESSIQSGETISSPPF